MSYKYEFPDIPLVTVAGNHDVRAKDNAFAREAYLGYMPGRMASELGVPVDSSDFSFRVGPDAFVVIDFNKPDDEKVANLIADASDARYLFVLIHCTVFPYDSTKYYKWYYHGKDKNPAARDRMRRLLAGNNAIVLCGHTHTTEFLDWYGDGGRITQMTMNSVWRDDATGVYEIQSEGPDQYGRLAAKPVFDEFSPGLKAYSRSLAAGSYKMNVSDNGVTVDFYPGDSTRAAHRFVLR
ncbi:MAG: metallophosphoesterase family protein [Candidatus Cryptobacteroides sp.]